jgi:hypothetical protein
MTPREYYESQAFFNKNLREMSDYDREHIIKMLSGYAVICVEECRTFVMGHLKDVRDMFHKEPEPQNFTDGLQ